MPLFPSSETQATLEQHLGVRPVEGEEVRKAEPHVGDVGLY